jgi:hypothetical protein
MKSILSELVSTRRFTVLVLALLSGFPRFSFND